MIPYQHEEPVESIFSERDFHTRASAGKRLANYIIDVIMFYIVMICLGVILATLSPSAFAILDNDSAAFGMADRIISLLLYALYMGTVESIFKGKSVGKLITKTRAVNLNGSPISTKTAFLRGLSRAVPLCVFSAFGSPCNPWQDKWTNTMVVNEHSKTTVY